MCATAVLEDHLMCSKICITGHIDCSGEICLDRKRLPYYQDNISNIPKQAYRVRMGSKDVKY
jgi:hypothetical protein